MNCNRLLLTGLIALGALGVNAQESAVLTPAEAIELALDFNYDIKIARNDVLVATNNASVYNSGFLPTLSLSGGSTVNNRTIQQAGDGFNFNASGTTINHTSSVNLQYTIFDGLGRQYNYRNSKLLQRLSEIQARQVIEGAILQLFTVYYDVARLTENKLNEQQSLEISRERLTRARYSFEYGQSTQLDVLNAEVDINTDSINVLTIDQQLQNAKRDLNLLLGRDVVTDFEVDTAIFYLEDLAIERIIQDALVLNASIQQADQFISTSENAIVVNKAGYLPRLDVNAGYSFNRSDFEESAPFPDQSVYGPNVGLSLSWNLFDGGLTKTRVQNARIALETDKINRERTEQQLFRNLNNAWTVYETAIFVLEAQRKNLETNRRNFNRTLEQNKLGQVTNIEFRQAQVNLINAQASFNDAKYSAKVAEIALLQLAGILLDTDF